MAWANASAFVKHLSRRGFETLGSGYFSTVMAKPGSDRVIKVLTQSEMDGWSIYVLWATRAGYAGTFAPKVHSFKTIKTKDGNTFYVAVVERLHKQIRDVFFDTAMYRMFQGIRETIAPGSWGDKPEHAKRLDAKARQFAIEFRVAFNDSGISTDLHDGNWMITAKRLVLTDPLSYLNGGTLEKHAVPPRWRAADYGL